MKIDRRTSLKLLGGALLSAPSAASSLISESTFASEGCLDDLYCAWIKQESILPVTFLTQLGLTEDLSGLKSQIKADFSNDNLFIYKGLYLSKTEVALVAHVAYLRINA
jgi:hypothetical protein